MPISKIGQHAFDAPIFAAMHAHELDQQGDLDGARNWRIIVNRIDLLPVQREGLAH